MKNWFDSLPFGFETIMSEEDLKYISNLLCYKLNEYMSKAILCQKKDCSSY